MLAIKLQRVGKKHQPSYRLVVAEKKSKMAGPPIEDLGSYNATTKQGSFNKERILYWTGVGARPTGTMHNLLVKNGIISAPAKAVKMNKPEPKEAAPEKKQEAEAVAEAPKKEVTEEAKVEKEPEAESVMEEKPAEAESPKAEEKPEEEAKAE